MATPATSLQLQDQLKVIHLSYGAVLLTLARANLARTPEEEEVAASLSPKRASLQSLCDAEATAAMQRLSSEFERLQLMVASKEDQLRRVQAIQLLYTQIDMNSRIHKEIREAIGIARQLISKDSE